MELDRHARMFPAAHALILALLLGAGACRRAPDEEDARQWYAKHLKTIDAIDGTIRQEIARMPRFSGKPFSCTPKAADPSLPSDLGQVVSEAHCSAQKLEWLEAHDKAELRFREETLHAFLDLPGVLGVAVSYQMPDTKLKNSLGRMGLCPGGFLHGTVRAGEGVEIDGRKLGWGLYQTAYQIGGGKQHGDGEGRPGIEIAWSFRAEPAVFDVTATILAEEETTVEWREGWLEK
jgi:hypothetical protein